MQEIINGIEQLAQVSSEVQKDPFAQQLRNEAVNMFDDACQTISMGDCISAAALVDCGNVITFHLSHILEVTHAFVEGCAHGVRDAVIGAAYCVLHPVKSVQHFAQATCVLAEKIAPYLPPHVPEIDDVQGWNHYMEQCDQVARTWQKAAHDLREAFNKTPTIDLAKGIARTVGHMGTNIFVTHSMTRLTSTLAHCAVQPTIFAAQTHVETMLAACRPARLFLKNLERVYKRMRRSYKRFTNKIAEYGRRLYTLDEIETESVALAQSTGEIALAPRDLPHHMIQQCAAESIEEIVLAEEYITGSMTKPEILHDIAQISAGIIEKGIQRGYSREMMQMLLEHLEKPYIEGCLKTLYQAMDELEHIPGFKKVFDNIMTVLLKRDFKRVKGAINEIHTAMKLKQNGHEIIELSRRLSASEEYDIITKEYVIECKNLHWDTWINDASKMKKFFDQTERGVSYASSIEKKYIVISKQPIPCNIREKLSAMNVIVFEG